jgi:hypothetical protein
MARVVALVGGLLMVTGAKATEIGDNAQARAYADSSKPSVGDYSKFLSPSALNRNHGVSPAASKTSATQDNIVRYTMEYARDDAAMRGQDTGRSSPVDLYVMMFFGILALGRLFGIRVRRRWSQPAALLSTSDGITTELQTGVHAAALPGSAATTPKELCRVGGGWLPSSHSSRSFTVLYATSPDSTAEGATAEAVDNTAERATAEVEPNGKEETLTASGSEDNSKEETVTKFRGADANKPKDYQDFNPDQPDIVQKFVKQRDDWWSAQSPFPGAPVDKNASEGPIDGLAKIPVPAYLWLLTSTVGAIAFIGCIFQLFYNVPPAPVLGVPLTAVILVLSGPAFIFLFLIAIKRGQREADEDDARFGG